MYGLKTGERFSMIKIYFVFCVFSASFISSFNAYAQPTSTADHFCNLAYCFTDQAAKTKYETDNNCRFADSGKCGASVKAIQGELNKISKSDPTYGFYRNQECIANKACFNKGDLNSSKWLDNVVKDFVTPLATLQNDWPKKIQYCNSLFIAPALRCQQAMAEYHISKDLQGSLNKNGCGTKKDWDQIGQWLADCINKGIKDDNVPNPFDWATAYASNTVQAERDKVRNACIQYRTSHNLQIEENS